MKRSEHDIQASFFEILSWEVTRDERFGAIYAVPNAGKRTIGTLMRFIREGLKTGVPDVCVSVPSGKWHGAYIEFKLPGEKLKPKQIEWFKRLTKQGYLCVVHTCEVEAYRWLVKYFKGELPE